MAKKFPRRHRHPQGPLNLEKDFDAVRRLKEVFGENGVRRLNHTLGTTGNPAEGQNRFISRLEQRKNIQKGTTGDLERQ